MSEHVTLDAPAAAPSPPALPDWLRRMFLEPNEQVAWWQGPTLRPWRAWFQTHQDRLIGAAFISMFVLPSAGMFVGQGGAFFGACFGRGCLGRWP